MNMVNESGQDPRLTAISPYTQSNSAMDAGSDGLSEIIWRGRWAILLSTIVAAGAAFAYLRIATPMYESTSHLLIERRNPRFESGVLQDLGSTSDHFLLTQTVVVTSPQVLAVAMRDPNLLVLPRFRDGEYVERLLRTLSATVPRQGDIVFVTASSPHAEDAAQLVNAVVRAYIQWHEVNRQLSSEDRLADLNMQLENRRLELEQKRKEQMQYEQRHPEVIETMQQGISSRTLDLLRHELAAARVHMAELESYNRGLRRFATEPERFRQYVYGYRASMAVAPEEGERALIDQEYYAIRSKVEQAVSGIGSAQRAHIALLAKRATELERKRAELDAQFVQDHTALAQALLEDASKREQHYAQMYEKELAKIQQVTGQNSQYALILSQCDLLEKSYDSLLGQINNLDVNSRWEGLRIHVLANGIPAAEPSSPQAARILGIALVVGVMLGTGTALVRDWTDHRVRSADEILAILGVPVLGAVPSISRRSLPVRGPFHRLAWNSRESEAYRAVRTALFFGVPKQEATTVLVTSPGALEGKTTLVTNLGVAMAQAGQRTLIIDADLRQVRRRRVFITNENSRGITDVLAGTTTLEEAIRPTEVQGLDVLESGRGTRSPSELLSSQAFVDILEQLKGRYDRILVDSPPVGIVTDAQILATRCDLTLLVLRAERTSRLLTLRARDALLTVGARVAGAVVNDVSKRDSRYSCCRAYSYPPGNHYFGNHRADHRVLPEEVGVLPKDEASAVEAGR